MKKLLLPVLLLFVLGSSFIAFRTFESKEILIYERFWNKNHRNGTLLAIGNSITAAKYWQYEAGNRLDMNVKNHCQGGIGIIAMVDGEFREQNGNNAFEDGLDSLRVGDVQDVNVIVMLPAYNERFIEYGQLTDMYDPATKTPNTIHGKMNYALYRIRELLHKGNNDSCPIFIVTPHCAGKYSYIDADGYDEYPAGSGRTMETLANALISNAKHNRVYYIDAYHHSGIDSSNWNSFQRHKQSLASNYLGNNLELINNGYNEPFPKMEALPEAVAEGSLATLKSGLSPGYTVYIYDGKQWVNTTSVGNFPWNADQLHLNKKGYKKLGRFIATQIDSTLHITKRFR